MAKLLSKMKCWFGGHNWTCAANEGIKATPTQLESLQGFHDYSTMYCKRCGGISTLNL